MPRVAQTHTISCTAHIAPHPARGVNHQPPPLPAGFSRRSVSHPFQRVGTLDGSDISAVFKQMRGKAMAQAVADGSSCTVVSWTSCLEAVVVVSRHGRDRWLRGVPGRCWFCWLERRIAIRAIGRLRHLCIAWRRRTNPSRRRRPDRGRVVVGRIRFELLEAERSTVCFERPAASGRFAISAVLSYTDRSILALYRGLENYCHARDGIPHRKTRTVVYGSSDLAWLPRRAERRSTHTQTDHDTRKTTRNACRTRPNTQ